MKPGRPIPALLLTKGERDILCALTRQQKCPKALALRARVILLCASGHSNTETAAELRLTIQTVGKWRQRFVEKRFDGLQGKPWPRKLSDADVDRVQGLTLEPLPDYITRSIAEASGLRRASVHRTWRAFSLQPDREETFRMLRDSLLLDQSK
jgi:hypothetical protein